MKNRKEENIDDRIKRVTKSVAAKKKALEIWEQEAEQHPKNSKRTILLGISIAASVTIISIIGINYFSIDTHTPEDGSFASYEYSAMQPSSHNYGQDYDIKEVKVLMDSEKYGDALEAIDAIMADTLIDPALSLEKKEEIRILHKSRTYELEWLKIMALIRLKKNVEAEDLLKEYSKIEGQHQKEAQEILNNSNRISNIEMDKASWEDKEF